MYEKHQIRETDKSWMLHTDDYRSAEVAQAVMELCDGSFRLLFEGGGFWIWVLI